MRPAYGYIRVSSDEQADSGLGLEAQRPAHPPLLRGEGPAAYHAVRGSRHLRRQAVVVSTRGQPPARRRPPAPGRGHRRQVRSAIPLGRRCRPDDCPLRPARYGARGHLGRLQHDEPLQRSDGPDGERVRGVGAGDDPRAHQGGVEGEARPGRAHQRPRTVWMGLRAQRQIGREPDRAARSRVDQATPFTRYISAPNRRHAERQGRRAQAGEEVAAQQRAADCVEAGVIDSPCRPASPARLHQVRLILCFCDPSISLSSFLKSCAIAQRFKRATSSNPATIVVDMRRPSGMSERGAHQRPFAAPPRRKRPFSLAAGICDSKCCCASPIYSRSK
jgi:hypothetical protein